MVGGCTHIHILDIILSVTKIGECYSASYGLQKLINVKDMFSVSNVGRNRKQQHQKVRNTRFRPSKEIRTHLFSIFNLGNLFIAE